MADENLILRIERFERTVATCLSAVPLFFAAPCVLLSLCVPAYERMFADFGTKLPGLTEFMFHARLLWLVLSLGLPVVAVIVARRSRPIFAVLFSTVTGFANFLIALFLAVAVSLPIMELGKVADGIK